MGVREIEIARWEKEKEEIYNKTGIPDNCAYSFYKVAQGILNNAKANVMQLDILDQMARKSGLKLDIEKNPWLAFPSLYSDSKRLSSADDFSYAVGIMNALYDENAFQKAYNLKKADVPKYQELAKKAIAPGDVIANSKQLPQIVQALDARMNTGGESEKETNDRIVKQSKSVFNGLKTIEDKVKFILSIIGDDRELNKAIIQAISKTGAR